MIQGGSVMLRCPRSSVLRTITSHTVKCRPHTSRDTKTVEEELVAALFVPGYRGNTVASVVSPYLDFSKHLENVNAFEHNIILRGMNVDVKNVINKWTKWNELTSQRAEVEGKKLVVMKALKTLGKNPKQKERAEELRERGRKLRDEAKGLAQQVWDLEETAIIPLLQLPNSLHHTTPQQDKLLFQFLDKPTFIFSPKNHMELGKNTGELEFMENSPTSYYLKKNLSVLELVCSEHFLSTSRAQNFLPTCNSDFVKGLVVEGSGVHFLQRHRHNQLVGQEGKMDRDPLYLLGGASVPAFAAYLTKQVVEKGDQLPQKLVTTGRNYQPEGKEDLGLFGCRQSTVVDGCILYDGRETSDEKQIFEETLISLIQNYSKIGIHFHVVHHSGHSLRMYESGAVALEMFSPSTGRYQEVGRISLCGDYISRRLWTLCKVEKKSAAFLHMIHIRFCNVTHLLGMLMENNQTEEGGYVVPEYLQSRADAY